MNSIHTSFVAKHRTALIFFLLIVAGGGYVAYQKSVQPRNETRSVLGTVERGTLSSTVSGSGQISVSNQVDVKPKVSGDIMTLQVKKGEEIKEGTVIATIDSRDAKKTVRDAQDNLATAKLALQKLKTPVERLALLQAQHSVVSAQESKKKAEKDLETARLDLNKLNEPADPFDITQANNAVTAAEEARDKADSTIAKAYDDAFSVVVSAFLDMPDLLSSLNNMFFQSSIERNQLNIDWYANQVNRWDTTTAQYQERLSHSYDTARAHHITALSQYKAASRTSDHATLDTLITQTITTATDIDTSIKAGKNFLDYVADQLQWHSVTIPSLLTSNKNALNTSIGTINTIVSNVTSVKRSLDDATNAIASADRTLIERFDAFTRLIRGPDILDVRAQEITIQQREQAIIDSQRIIEERAEALVKLNSGTDPLDIRSQELAIQQRKNILLDAQEKLLDYTITAPFDSIVAQSDARKGDVASLSTVLATLITKQRIAEITLNEVDVSKIAVKQKAILTLDALPDMSITGEVADIDTIGTVSQGVVSYIVKIVFDTQDGRVKPGMSVSATIITAVRTDTLIVTNTAVKSQGDGHFVEVPASDDPQARSLASGIVLSQPTIRKQVEIGLSNDENTEILSGLKEGDRIVTNTITVQKTSTSQSGTQSQSPALRIPGLPGGGGGAFRSGGGGR